MQIFLKKSHWKFSQAISNFLSLPYFIYSRRHIHYNLMSYFTYEKRHNTQIRRHVKKMFHLHCKTLWNYDIIYCHANNLLALYVLIFMGDMKGITSRSLKSQATSRKGEFVNMMKSNPIVFFSRLSVKFKDNVDLCQIKLLRRKKPFESKEKNSTYAVKSTRHTCVYDIYLHHISSLWRFFYLTLNCVDLF